MSSGINNTDHFFGSGYAGLGCLVIGFGLGHELPGRTSSPEKPTTRGMDQQNRQKASRHKSYRADRFVDGYPDIGDRKGLSSVQLNGHRSLAENGSGAADPH
jgi:hypothetical protein